MKVIICDRCKRSNEVKANINLKTNDWIQEVSLVFDEEGNTVTRDLCGNCVNEVKRTILEKV